MRPLLFTKIYLAFSLILLTTLSNYNAIGQTITPVAGGIGDGLNALTYGRLVGPKSVVADRRGNIYIMDNGNFRIRKISPTGVITTYTGSQNNCCTIGGLGGPAKYASYSNINYGLIADSIGNIYFTTYYSVCKIDTSGILSLVAGTSASFGGFSGDGSLATLANLNQAGGITMDRSGNLYIADYRNNRIRRVSTAGIITTVAGGGGSLGDGGLAISAQLNGPTDVATDNSGNLYIADNNRIRKVNSAGIISTIAGNGSGGYTGDGAAATLATIYTSSIRLDATGNIYLSGGNSIRKINTSGIISTIAGSSSSGYGGDGGLAVSGSFYSIGGFHFDTSGNILVSDYGNNRIRKINTSGIISTIAGNNYPISGYSENTNSYLAVFSTAKSIVTDQTGNSFVIDGNRVRKISATGGVSLYAGNGIIGYSGDGGPATAAELDAPTALALDRYGNLYIADNGTNHIRKVNTSGIITTIAGGGSGGLGDGGPATAAVITAYGVAVDTSGNVFIADATNNRIRMINTSGIISTFAGTGVGTTNGNGGPASAAAINQPLSITIDKKGNIYTGTYDGIRKINANGIIYSTSPTRSYFLTTDKLGNLYYSTSYQIQKLDTFGYTSPVAGRGVLGYMGDFGPATAAEINSASGISIDTAGYLYITDQTNVRKICCMPNFIDRPPLFTSGSTATLNVCSGSTANPINSLLSITDGDTSNSLSWTISSAPTHGSLNGFTYSSTSTGGLITPSGLSYTPTTGYWGVDHFTIQISDNTDINTIVVTVNINALPNAGTIFGASALCTGATTTLTESVTGGIWSSSNSTCTIGSAGLVSAISLGIDTIKYSVTNACGTTVATHTIAISTGPGPITGTLSVCEGANTTLSNSVSGGIWTSSNISLATIGTGSGTATGVSYGYAGISYTLGTGCRAIATLTVNPAPNAGTITGLSSLCVGTTNSFTVSATSGTWSATNASATVSGSGLVTAISSGTDTIQYTVSNSCGTATSSKILTINALPTAGTIIGPSAVCVSSTITLSNSAAGGVWSSPDPYVSVSSSTGLVAGIANGTATISYTIANACGTAYATKVISVSPLPSPGSITGSTTLCTGGSTTLSATVSGGTWQSGNTSIATIGSTGTVTGIAVGSVFISYTVTNGCGSSTVTTIINDLPASPITPITGASSLCSGTTTTLAEATTGGSWSSANTAVATIGSTGIVTGVSGGIAVISYTEALGCGVSVATFNITVNTTPTAGTISGPAALCTGNSAILSSYITGGTWLSSNSAATIGITGFITAVSPGLDTITYTVTNSCGSASTTKTLGIYPSPVPGTITGSSSLCAGSNITLTDAAAGGIWTSSDNSIATIGTSGIVTGIAGGNVIISYTVSTACASASATKNITVNAPNAGLITGVTNICAGGTTTLSPTISGGTWLSSNISVATIGTTGTVNAIAPGSTIISYTVGGACGSAVATTVFTVGTLPVIGSISGSSSICSGSSATFTNSTLGGVWSSSNPSVASATGGGLVSGISIGTSVISYSITAGCGTSVAIFPIRILTTPTTGTISGSTSLCAGTNTTLTVASTGGIWTSSNNSIATANSTSGIVTGISAGSATISYTITNICGAANATYNVGILPAPDAGTISGLTMVCVGSSIALTNASAGGLWSSASTVTASIGSLTGVCSGLTSGPAVIQYSVTNSCGTATSTKTITINPLPVAGSISGLATVCVGATISLTDTITGGIWHSSNSLMAGVSSTGVVSGLSTGTVIIGYDITNLCGTATATKSISVISTNAGTITGLTTLCAGSSTTLTDAISGGTWTSSITGVATIGSTGTVNAISGGTTLISYTVTNACGTASATQIFTVSNLPTVSAITGPTAICNSSSTLLTDGTTGGVWSSTNPSVASIGTSGLVTGLSAGTTTISYLITAGCGSVAATSILRVETTPIAGTITGTSSVCRGANATFTSSVGGGLWSSSNITKAIVTGGIVTGIDTGTAIISYSVSNSCASISATYTTNIITTPYPGFISSTTNICSGATSMLTDTVSGGVWSSSNLATATIGTSGLVIAGLPGSTVITYRVANSCGANDATTTLNIDPLPYIEAINGTTTIYTGYYGLLTDAVPGGSWTSSNPSVATINAGGVLMGITTGTTIITYSLVNSFGCTADTTVMVTVNLFTGIENLNNENGYTIFPNPAAGEFSISWENQSPGTANLTLTDVAGRVVLSKELAINSIDGKTNLALNGLLPGVYSVSIVSTNTEFRTKLVIVE